MAKDKFVKFPLRAKKKSEVAPISREFWKEILKIEKELDALIPGWDEPMGDGGIRGTKGMQLAPQILLRAKVLLKERHLRYMGYPNSAHGVQCARTGKVSVIVKF